MRESVIRGTREYPGASMIEFEDGHLQFLARHINIYGEFRLNVFIIGQIIFGATNSPRKPTINTPRRQ